MFNMNVFDFPEYDIQEIVKYFEHKGLRCVWYSGFNYGQPALFIIATDGLNVTFTVTNQETMDRIEANDEFKKEFIYKLTRIGE